jgi:phytanoyl-CoA hydroxylase
MWADTEQAGLKPLWTDAADSLSRLDAKVAAGVIKPAERDDLAHFIERGWLIKKNAIPHPLIDRFVSDIRSHSEKPGYFVTTDHRNGKSQLKVSGDRPDAFESLFDLYVNLASSREVCMHPVITRFLSLVMEAKPMAFQQLLFQRSNGHQVHQDTAFVAVEEPLCLAASWIALQDVVEGSGELSFYDRSHKLPHFLFKDGTKRFNGAADNMAEYNKTLEDACETRKLTYERFIAKKGDVFFWAADLVHRSHPKSLPEETPRMSCVTHYCPETVQPFWFRFFPDNRGVERHKTTGAFASSYYTLPNHGQLIRPNRT